jgi:ABC-type lipoprotein release transport system permease subunit
VLLKLAWRSIWRNRRRTIISLLALAIGVMAIVALHSFRIAAYEEMIRSVTRGLVGDIQIHGLGYQDSPEIGTVVTDPAAVEATVAATLPEARTEKRVVGAGLASSVEVATAVMVLGIEPANPSVQAVIAVKQGRALATQPARVSRSDQPGEPRPRVAGEAMIGIGLAAELNLAPGGELVLVGQAADGSVANDRFTVVGTVDTGSSEVNATAVFLHLPDAQSFFALGAAVHQIIVRLPDDAHAPGAAARLGAASGATALEIVPWTRILPELKGSMDAKAKNMRVIDLIVFLIVGLGVLNTMTMSTFERTRELGVLAALGTRRDRILGMILLETLLLGLIGFAIGVGLAYALLLGLGSANLGSLGGDTDVLGARLPETIQLAVYGGPVAGAAVVTVLTMLAGGLLPAIRAARLVPVEAMRYV